MTKRKKLKKRVKKSLLLLIIGIISINCFYAYLNDTDSNSIASVNTSTSNYNYDNPNPLYDSVSSEKKNVGTIKDRLKKLSKEDSRINEILKDYDKYPEALLDMLSRNSEMVDFVINYPKKKGKVYSETIGTFKNGTYPLLLQWDQRWGYADYGNSNIAIEGCAPTALAMVIAGLTGKNDITPYNVAKYAEKNGYYISGSGTSWDLMTTGSKHFGIEAQELPLSKSKIFNALESGKPIICSMRKGDFTTSGHFIVLVGIEDGKIKVNDPASKERSSILWEYERIESQIKNLWEFTIKS